MSRCKKSFSDHRSPSYVYTEFPRHPRVRDSVKHFFRMQVRHIRAPTHSTAAIENSVLPRYCPSYVEMVMQGTHSHKSMSQR